jgi:hypothetical protein
MIICKNGTEHTHESVTDSKICWGVLSGYVSRPVSPAPAPASTPVASWRLGPARPKQVNYVGILKGDQDFAAGLTAGACSDYIDSLLKKKGTPVTAPTPPLSTLTYRQERTKRQDFILGLLPEIPDGYFAVSPDGTDANIHFIRIKRPTAGQYRNCVKVQTQHSEVLDNKFIYNIGADRIWEKRGFGDEIEQDLLYLFADWQGSAMRYSRLIGKCCRCNLVLTDGRSRHYGIGPDCDDIWTWVINVVDEKNDGLSYEDLVRLGRV